MTRAACSCEPERPRAANSARSGREAVRTPRLLLDRSPLIPRGVNEPSPLWRELGSGHYCGQRVANHRARETVLRDWRMASTASRCNLGSKARPRSPLSPTIARAHMRRCVAGRGRRPRSARGSSCSRTRLQPDSQAAHPAACAHSGPRSWRSEVVHGRTAHAQRMHARHNTPVTPALRPLPRQSPRP